MSSLRERAIREVAKATGMLEQDIIFHTRPHRELSALARYAVEMCEASLRKKDLHEQAIADVANVTGFSIYYVKNELLNDKSLAYTVSQRERVLELESKDRTGDSYDALS